MITFSLQWAYRYRLQVSFRQFSYPSKTQTIASSSLFRAVFSLRQSSDSNIEQRRLIDWIHPPASSSFHVTPELIWAAIMIYEQNFIKVFQLFLWVRNPIKLLSRLLRKDHDIRKDKKWNNWRKTFRQVPNAFSHLHLHLSFLNIKCHFLANRHLKLNCNVMLWRISSYLPI